LAANYEEIVAPRSWITSGWKDLLQRIYEYSPDELSFEDDTDPTEVVHTMFLRLQEAEGRNRNKKKSQYYNWDILTGPAETAMPQEAPPIVQGQLIGAAGTTNQVFFGADLAQLLQPHAVMPDTLVLDPESDPTQW
jgi:hypothetical protein